MPDDQMGVERSKQSFISRKENRFDKSMETKMKTLFLFKIFLIVFLSSEVCYAETASWYDSKSACGKKTNNLSGCPTASGVSIYQLEDRNIPFCASNDYPLGARLKITSLDSGKETVCTVYDRGGFKKYGRAIDLSKRNFKELAPLTKGIINVSIERLK
jgi:rare lipoprotein A (peptidoglycan hydrolase)